MKKILFLLLVCLIKLNAYEYEVYNTGGNHIIFYTDKNGNVLKQRDLFIRESGYENLYNVNLNRQYLSRIRFNSQWGFIHNDVFDSYYKNDLLFLNDLYTSNNYNLISFLNYLYNNSEFSDSNYINYENYELLYNTDGQAVESIVNGVWAGLYDDLGQSGNLYNKKGDLIYINGVSASFFDKINDKLMKRFNINLESIFIKQIFYPVLVMIFACVIFRSVIRMAVKAFLIRFYDNKIKRLEKRRENIENA